jgi:hypothetical protein
MVADPRRGASVPCVLGPPTVGSSWPISVNVREGEKTSRLFRSLSIPMATPSGRSKYAGTDAKLFLETAAKVRGIAKSPIECYLRDVLFAKTGI